MSDFSGQQARIDISSLLEDDPALEQEVCDYLKSHPDFFVKHDHLLRDMDIVDARQGSVSLVELQNKKLKEDNQLLAAKLRQLIDIARENEKIYRIYTNLNLRLLKVDQFGTAQQIIEEVMQNELGMSAATIKVFRGPHALPEIHQKLFREKRLRGQRFFFGRLNHHEKNLLFSKQPVESAALMVIGDKLEMGMLAVGSKDPSHFHPEMDTLLINQLQQFLSVLLPKLFDF